VQQIYVPLRGRHDRGLSKSRRRIDLRRVRENVVHGTEVRTIEDVVRLSNQIEPHPAFTAKIHGLRNPHIPAIKRRPSPGIPALVIRTRFASMTARGAMIRQGTSRGAGGGVFAEDNRAVALDE